ncbi:hypothetical protein BC835DRAFT_319565 [Cytidiella melzeri]|nr:hypothetical protein BC835DRAFT_319565 [Cytidiella melzeri]
MNSTRRTTRHQCRCDPPAHVPATARSTKLVRSARYVPRSELDLATMSSKTLLYLDVRGRVFLVPPPILSSCSRSQQCSLSLPTTARYVAYSSCAMLADSASFPALALLSQQVCVGQLRGRSHTRQLFPHSTEGCHSLAIQRHSLSTPPASPFPRPCFSFSTSYAILSILYFSPCTKIRRPNSHRGRSRYILSGFTLHISFPRCAEPQPLKHQRQHR